LSAVREVTLPKPDEDGEPVKTLVIDWGKQEPRPAGPSRDPWEQDRDARTPQSLMLLKRVLMAKLAQYGRELPLDPPVRGIDIEIVRAEFYAQTPADGIEKQKNDFRRARFDRAVARASEWRWMDLREFRELEGKTFLWLLQQQPDPDDF
jgi:hypothetical protein